MEQFYFGKWAWLLFVFVTLANASIMKGRSKAHIRQDPSLERGYRTIINGFLFWGNLPWLVMGAGCLLGGIPSVFHFFDLRSGNPYVVAFFCTLFLIWGLGSYWLILRGGAESLVRHPGIISREPRSAKMIILFWCVSVAAGLVFVVMALTQTLPLEEITRLPNS